jgi:hypothetical protein
VLMSTKCLTKATKMVISLPFDEGQRSLRGGISISVWEWSMLVPNQASYKHVSVPMSLKQPPSVGGAWRFHRCCAL